MPLTKRPGMDKMKKTPAKPKRKAPAKPMKKPTMNKMKKCGTKRKAY
jgi:hypothetical protein